MAGRYDPNPNHEDQKNRLFLAILANLFVVVGNLAILSLLLFVVGFDRLTEQPFICCLWVFVQPYLKMSVWVDVVFLGDYLWIAEIVLPCHLATVVG